MDDCDLGKISNEIYSEYILNENQKFKGKEISFLIENFIFQTVSVKLFKKNIFHEFVRLSFPKYSFIFKQNQITDYLYFICEGEVELSIELNLLQLNDLIQLLGTKLDPDNKKSKIIEGKEKLCYLRH